MLWPPHLALLHSGPSALIHSNLLHSGPKRATASRAVGRRGDYCPGLAALELRSSWLQSRILTAISHRTTFAVLPGRSESIRYTRSGPYDKRLGYSRIPEFVQRTESRVYEIEAQARPSRVYVALADLGVYPIYREKDDAGLEVLDRHGSHFPVCPTRTVPISACRFRTLPGE